MALSKVVQTEYGVNVSYWIPIGIQVDIPSQSIKVVFGGFVSESNFLDGKSALLTESFSLNFEDLGLDEIGSMQSTIETSALTKVPSLADAEII